MAATRSPDAVAARVLSLAYGSAALLIAAAAGLTFYGIGLLPGTEATDADYLWRAAPLLDRHRTATGAVSMIVFVVAAVTLTRMRKAGDLSISRAAQIIVLTFFGAWLGIAYGVATAPVVGANIGGGMALLLTPVFAGLALALVVVLQVWRPPTAKQ